MWQIQEKFAFLLLLSINVIFWCMYRMCMHEITIRSQAAFLSLSLASNPKDFVYCVSRIVWIITVDASEYLLHMFQNVPLSVFSSQRFIIGLGNNSWGPFSCSRWSLRKPSDLNDNCWGRSDLTESFSTAVFELICFNLFVFNKTYYCLYSRTNIHTVSHKSEYTPHISVNLLYLFMGQHWRNDTWHTMCSSQCTPCITV